jgi:predicted transposase YdaD
MYDRYWDSIRIERTYYHDAIDKGIAEGRAKGIAEGKAKWMAKGRAEELKNVIINAKHTGLSIAQIQSITKLSKEKIEEILHQHK